MKKRISAFIISLTLAAACFAGCGDSDSSSSKKKSSNADTSTSADSQTEKDDSEDDTSDGKDVSEDGGTGSDLPVENTGYDRESFYKALDEEYQKYGLSCYGLDFYTVDGYMNFDGTICNKDGVVLDVKNIPELNTTVKTADGEAQESGNGSLEYCNGYWYYEGKSLKSQTEPEEYMIAQLDLQGNVLNKIIFNNENFKKWGLKSSKGNKDIKSVDSHGLGLIYANPDGDAIVSCKLEFEGNGNELIWLYIAKGSNKPVQISAPENSDFDSLYECAGYKNKYYARSSKKYYCLDMTDLSWTELDMEVKEGKNLTVGKFWFSCNKHVKYSELSTDLGFVYDMETDKIIADNPVCYYAMMRYRGGDSIIVPVQLNDNEKTNVCELKLPFDKSDENASSEKITLYICEDENTEDRAELKGYEIIKDYGSEIAENLPRGSLVEDSTDNISKMCYVYKVNTDIDSKHINYKYYLIDFSSGTPVEKFIYEYNS